VAAVAVIADEAANEAASLALDAAKAGGVGVAQEVPVGVNY